MHPTPPVSVPVKHRLGSLFAIASAALGGLLFGFDTAVIAGATGALQRVFSLTPFTLGLTVSCALWGTVLGGLFAAPPAERFGARECLRATAVLYFFSALGCAFALSWPVFLLARLVGGLAIGGSSVFGPMYIADISPAAVRGRRVACFQLSIVVGILAAYASNFLIGSLRLGPAEWRVELGIAALPALLFFAVLRAIPPSPRWLVRRGRLTEARAALQSIDPGDPEPALRQLALPFERDASHRREHGRDSLLSSSYRKPLLIGAAMGVFNQCSGVNAVLYYLNDIFASAGFSGISAARQAVAVGFANLAATVAAMALIDRLGRKPLLLIGAAGMALALAGISAVFLTGERGALLLPLLIAFICFFAFSQGAVIWVYLSELFPPAVREKGQGFATFWLWLLAAVVAALFPRVAAISSGYPFVFFAAMMAVQFFVVLLFFPETKGLSLEALPTQ